MALDLITGHQGVAHISAEQISDINKAMMNGYGDNKVMRMSGGAITQNALTLEIATGYWRANGFDIQIQESETHYIDPSTIGTSRIDNIYVELLQDIPTGAQRAEITIIMGEEAASPVAPEDPTEPYLNTDILLDAVQIGTVTVTEGAMVFTDLTEAYDLVTPSELSAVQTLATNALGMIQDDSDAYSSSKAYAVGDLCIHDDVVYKCITACSAAAWSVNQNCFEATTLTDELSTLKDALTDFGTYHNCDVEVYDLDTYKRTFTDAFEYFKIGHLIIGQVFKSNADLSGISTMLQLRIPVMSWVYGGGVFIATQPSNGGELTIQASSKVYIRPNWTSSKVSNPSNVGVFSCFFIGYSST